MNASQRWISAAADALHLFKLLMELDENRGREGKRRKKTLANGLKLDRNVPVSAAARRNCISLIHKLIPLRTRWWDGERVEKMFSIGTF